jgi:hypothetical protein
MQTRPHNWENHYAAWVLTNGIWYHLKAGVWAAAGPEPVLIT